MCVTFCLSDVTACDALTVAVTRVCMCNVSQKKSESCASDAVLSKALMQQKEKESNFLDQLLDPHKIDDYQLPIPISAELRKYQQVCCSLCTAMGAMWYSHHCCIMRGFSGNRYKKMLQF